MIDFVITTVSSPAKAQLAAAAGASHVIDYRRQDVTVEVRKIVPAGVDAIVEVSPSANAALDAEVLGHLGTVAMYAGDGGAELTLPIRPMMAPNARWQFVLVYTEPAAASGSVTRLACPCTATRSPRPPRRTPPCRTRRWAAYS